MLPQEEKPPSEFRMKKFWASIAAEYLGTGLLVYIATSVCNVSDTNLRDNTKASGNLECALANGLGVATIVHWTEGLLNPALAVAFTSTGKLSLTKGVLLIIMEIVGGISGAALTYALTPSRLRHTLGDTVLHEDMSTMQGLFVEFILTLILTLAVYATRDAGRKCEGYHSSLAYGFAVVSCYLVGYKYTSCGINPARSFGPAVIREISGLGKPNAEWQHHWIYWIGPIGGSLLGGVIYHFLFAQPSFEYDVCKAIYTRNNHDYRERESETNL
ncbi:aquaporin AQPcic-like isoform X1 [Dendronephthya gigantea]|uniref:aquaporin AQPcic-like isoform X1 n=1 Tax=Dendronephthya gigantea TaxID=151771 RepID=UPI00106B5D40|nr:aquaporin AQPcic-like isoform X1 [Dendronephthya gigantea]